MRRTVLVAAAVLATTSAHAELSGQAATPAATPATQSAPVAVQAAPAAPILQTTNPQAQRVLKELQAHGLIKLQPQPVPQAAPATSAAVVTAPAQGQVTQSQVTQSQATQTQSVQAQAAPTQPVATATRQPGNQTVTAPVASSVSVQKPTVHVTGHRDADEAKARRIAARYGIHW